LVGGPGTETVQLQLHNEHGLDVRLAARLVETARRFDADVTVCNLTSNSSPVSGRSITALSMLGALAGDRIEVGASGRQFQEALAAIAALVRRNFDEGPAGGARDGVHGPRLAGPLPVSPGIGIGPKTSFLPGHPHFHLPVTPPRARRASGSLPRSNQHELS
jgi:multiphosphoryl transfer protein